MQPATTIILGVLGVGLFLVALRMGITGIGAFLILCGIVYWAYRSGQKHPEEPDRRDDDLNKPFG